MEFDLPESVLEELQKVWKREWKKLTLADDFIFSRIMQNIDVCKEVLEMLLKIKISHIEFPIVQKVIQTLKASKGVRMDVYVQEPDGQRVFDIEIQSVITKEEALRARYYKGMLDLDNLLKGNDYIELPETYIIFLCMKDPFHLNLPIYEPRSYIDPNNQHPYDDKTKKKFYNDINQRKYTTGVLRGRQPLSSAGGARSKHNSAKLLAKGGFRRDKVQDIVAPCTASE